MPLTTDSVFHRLSVDYVDSAARLSWRMQYGFDYKAPMQFQPQFSRSGIPLGTDWVDVGAPVVDAFSATDATRRARGKDISCYYRVKATDAEDTVYYSEPIRADGLLSQSLWLRARALVRDFNIGLRRIGTPCWLLRKIHDGDMAPNETAIITDPFSGTVLTTRFKPTAGTEYAGGFFTPTRVFIDIPQIGRNGEANLESGIGSVDPDQSLVARACGIPYIANGDVFVTQGSGERFEVQGTQPATQIHTTPVIISLTIKKFPADDIIYSIPVPR